jgi:hypothetical protein
MPLVDRVECAGSKTLRLLRGQMFAYPGFAQRRCEGLRRIDGESARLLHHAECRAAGLALGCGRTRHLPRRLPCRVGFDRAAARQELTEHRVVYPSPGEETRPNFPVLRCVRAQRPRPHVCRRVLRTLTRPRPHSRSLRSSGRRWTDAEPVTRRHITTVEVTTDNPPARTARAADSQSRSRRWLSGSQATLPYAVRNEFTSRLVHAPHERPAPDPLLL